MAAVHTWIAGLDRVGDYCTFIIAAEHVVSLAKGYNLFETECVLNDNYMAEILGLYIVAVLAYTYGKALAAVFTLEYQRLTFLVACGIKIYGMVTFRAYNLAHE